MKNTIHKVIIIFLLLNIFTAFSLKAAWFNNLPMTITQPDGTVIECFASGDEFFNWLHDKDGFTIIQAEDGYYYYGQTYGDKVIPTLFKVNSVNPEKVGITAWAKISTKAYEANRSLYEINTKSVKSTQTGTINNIAVYVRFSDDAEFSIPRSTYETSLNATTRNSLKSYYNEVSYNKLLINTTHYPACALTTNLSYKDSHPRRYFSPYNATTNTIGYATTNERTTREHILLQDAINWINANSAVPTSLNIDGDNDGNVDNVLFIIRGNCDGWSDLLWAHRWSLFSLNVKINGKRVYDYTLQPENQVDVQTLCHEMFHSLGAPDLYHYNSNFGFLASVGSWDIMEQGGGHMGAYMKWKYSKGTWITSIPTISAIGTYTLNPLTSSTNNCYKIAVPGSTTEFYVLEYRKQTGTFENNLPGSGLIVYRINSNFIGNAQFDGVSSFDEVYIYRPGGSSSSLGNFANGNPFNAFLSNTSGRTSLNFTTNPKCELTNGTDGGLKIANVTVAGNTISFDIVAFSDVQGTWAEKEINYMKAKNFIAGYADGTFKPNNNLTRAEFATMIVKVLNPPIKPEYSNRNFTDIEGHWAKANILQVARAGYMNGYPDGTFKPNNTITKTEILVTIANGMGLSGGNVNILPTYFDDATQIANWAKQSVANATSNSFVPNYPIIKNLEPNKNASRAEAVVLLYQALVKKGIAPEIANAYVVKYTVKNSETELSNTENIKINNSFSIYPNPSNGNLNIVFDSETRNAELIIYDIFGKKVMNKILENQQLIIYQDISDLNNGFYIVQIKNGNNTKSQRLVILK